MKEVSMKKEAIDLVKHAEKLTPRERAKLVVASMMAELYGCKEKVLSQEIINALSDFEDYSDYEEFRQYLSLFRNAFLFLVEIDRGFSQFGLFYGNLKSAHYLLALSQGIACYSGRMASNAKNHQKEEESPKAAQMIYELEVDGKKYAQFSDKVVRIFQAIPDIHDSACKLLTYEKVLAHAIAKLDSDFPWLRLFHKIYRICLEYVKNCIAEHNKAIFDAARRCNKVTVAMIKSAKMPTEISTKRIKAYLIEKPTIDAELLEQLEKDLFEKGSGNADNECEDT
jgi:hypothetical protein